MPTKQAATAATDQPTLARRRRGIPRADRGVERREIAQRDEQLGSLNDVVNGFGLKRMNEPDDGYNRGQRIRRQ